MYFSADLLTGHWEQNTHFKQVYCQVNLLSFDP